MTYSECLRAIADFLFPLPDHCVICQQHCVPAEMSLCDSCLSYLRRPFSQATHLCPVCGRPEKRARICAECATTPRSFGKVIPGSIYREPVRTLVHRLKYAGHPDLSCALARLMITALGADRNGPESGPRYDCVVPVPVHPSRLAVRQYNQARLLADEISHATGIRLVEALRKTRQPESQALLDRQSRLTSLSGAFEARLGAERRIREARVLLVDDVFTTGATAHSCTLELLRIGALQVDVCVASIGIISGINNHDHMC